MNPIILILIVLIVLILVILLYTNITRVQNNEKFEFTKLPKEFEKIDPIIMNELYDMLKTTHDIFTKNNVTYWITDGTLLGLYRHNTNGEGHMIPWDDDIDIQIHENDVFKLNSLHDDFLRNGLVLMKVWFGYKIFPIDGKIIDNYDWKYPYLDIFVMRNQGDRIVYKNREAYKMWNRNSYYYNDEIYPVKLYRFHGFYVYGPNNGLPYLDRYYGDKWIDVAEKSWDHENEKMMKLVRINLDDIE